VVVIDWGGLFQFTFSVPPLRLQRVIRHKVRPTLVMARAGEERVGGVGFRV